jgi:putative ABC transport system permease protein
MITKWHYHGCAKGMLRNYIVIALRNLWKNKGFSAINIAGLTMGMACSLLILLWVRDELSVDAFHTNSNRLYALYETQYFDGKADGGYYTPALLAAEMKKTLPEVESATQIGWQGPHTMTVGDKAIKEDGNYAGADFFSMFSFPLIEGRASSLSGLDAIAISRTMAKEFFGSPSDAMGKTIRYDNKKDMIVRAVYEDMPASSTLHFSFLTSWDWFLQENPWMNQWGNNGPQTYLLLKPGTDPVAFEKKVFRYLDNYNKEQDKTFQIRLGMQRFGDIHLHNHFENGHPDGGAIAYVRLFSLVALFILVIACINFMNLTTARSLKRAKEIGVRKAMGAARRSLIRQFIGEAVLMTVVAGVITIPLIAILLTPFNALTGKAIPLPFDQGGFWVAMGALVLVTGLVSGSYPAFYLSSFSPLRVLKSSRGSAPGALILRKGLVVFQFALSILLIISTILVARQVKFLLNADLGYDRENLLYVPIEGELATKLPVFNTEILHRPGIAAISLISQDPTNMYNSTGGVTWPGKDPSASPQFTNAEVGYDFASTMRIHVLKGRDYSRDFATDSVGYILNEAALKVIGYKDPIGQSLTFWGKKGSIIGVFQDFHYASLHTTIQPLILRLGKSDGDNGNGGVIIVRTLPGKTREAIASLGQLCKELNPKFPFTFKFSSDEYATLYYSEQVTGRLSVIFAILAIAISCLGLLGLSIFTAEQRTKEIGIRKVLGAGAATLFNLLSREFLVLIGIAFAIAAPLGWWAMHQWLRQFPYQTDIKWWVFAASGGLVIFIALVTVCFQTVKSIRANPVKSLRSE